MKLQKAIGMASLALTMTMLSGCAGMEPPPSQRAQVTVPPSLQKIWNDPPALFKSAQKNSESGDFSLALTALKRITMAFPKSEIYAQARQLQGDVEKRLGEGVLKIGVVLPLTGRFSRYGEAALDGISCGIGLYEPCPLPENTAIQLVVKDSQGSAALAGQAVKELIENEKVTAIVGPLASAETELAALEAQNHNVPLIALAPKKIAAPAGDYVFQHSLFPETEVALVVRRAAKKGLNRFLLLYPKNKYGEQYRRLFTEEIEHSGRGKIAAELGYDPDLPEFSGTMERFIQRPAVDKVLQDGNGKRVGIFIPDSHFQVGRIARALDQLGLSGPTLVGTSRWFHPLLLRSPAKILEGAIIDTPFNNESPRNSTQNFSNIFSQAFGNKPAWLEALGFDAAQIILSALRRTGNGTGPTLRDAIKSADISGAIGSISFDYHGATKWDIDFVTIRGGKFTNDS